MAEDPKPRPWTAEDEAELEKTIRESDEFLTSAPRINPERLRGAEMNAESQGYGLEEEVASDDDVKAVLPSRPQRRVGRSVRISREPGKSELEIWQGGKVVGTRPLTHGMVIQNPTSHYFYKDKPHWQGNWAWDDNAKEFVRQEDLSAASAGMTAPVGPPPAPPTTPPAGPLPGESELDAVRRQRRELEERLAALLGGTTESDDTKGVKKRARKKVRLDKKENDPLKGRDEEGTDAGEGIRPGTQQHLKNVVMLRKKEYDIPDMAIGDILGQIDRAKDKNELIAVENRLNRDYGTDYGKKKGKGKPDMRKGPGVGGSIPVRSETRRNPNGSIDKIERVTDPATGEVTLKTTRLQEATTTSAQNKAWDDMTAAEQDATRLRNANQQNQEREEKEFDWNTVKPTARRGILGWWDKVMGRTPPMTPEAQRLLGSKETFSRDDMIRMHGLALRAAGMPVMAKERGVEKPYGRIAERFKKIGRAALTAVAVTATLAALGITAPLTIPSLIGAAAGAATSTYLKEKLEKGGSKHPILYSMILGSLVGIGTGAIANGIDHFMERLFSSGAAGAEAVTAAPSSAPPPGVTPTDFARFEEYAVLDPRSGGSVWSILTDQMKDCGMLDKQGREAFAHAFHKLVDAEHLQGILLTTESGQAISGYAWNSLPPVNIEVHYGKLFENQALMEKFCNLIHENYPTLEGKIGRSGAGTVEAFIKGLGYRYGVR